MNFFKFSKLIGTRTCLQEDSFVIILILGLTLLFFFSFTTLCISSTFLEEKFEKEFLIFIISLIFVEDACV